MKKLLVIFSLLISCDKVMSQLNQNLFGKWKVISINNGVYCNFQTDSILITKALTNSLMNRKDSAERIISLTYSAKQYKNYFFILTSNHKYKEIRNKTLVAKGRFSPPLPEPVNPY